MMLQPSDDVPLKADPVENFAHSNQITEPIPSILHKIPVNNALPIRNGLRKISQPSADNFVDLTTDQDPIRESSLPPTGRTSSKRPRPQSGLDKAAELLDSSTSDGSWSKSASPDNSSIQFHGGRSAKQFVSAIRVPRFPRPQPTPDECERRKRFLQNLSVLNGVTLSNDVDNDTPPTEFQFVAQSKLGAGVVRATEDVMLGCGCQTKYKQRFGCVYLNYCSCIEDSAIDNNGKKCFPYGASDNNYRCLRPKVLESRNHIYECNSKCDCTLLCKNRVVQHGRQVRLQIFKTRNRAWGLRSMDHLQKGQFIDTYRGEIITSDEADHRGRTRPVDEPNFLFDFDKFEGTDAYDPSRPYVCDGQYVGSPSRFINHSCAPNCRLFTVSYNHNDRNIYELAFFALFDIFKGTELTFDYHDEENPILMTDEMADDHERDKGYRPTKCLCGSIECRGYFFP